MRTEAILNKQLPISNGQVTATDGARASFMGTWELAIENCCLTPLAVLAVGA